jgi:hypothetical protein
MAARHDAANGKKRDDRDRNQQQRKIDQHGSSSIHSARVLTQASAVELRLGRRLKKRRGSKVGGEWQPAGGHSRCL